tara:strand:- start:2926 stop:3375 length:450 start_codon:yes stop_codon:yes gene_type:complete
MYRFLIFCIFLFFNGLGHAAIYHWIDEQGGSHYSQRPPRDKTIISQKIVFKTIATAFDQQAQPTIQDSANEIAKSNAERQATHEKTQQEAKENSRLQERCATSKKNLLELDFGGNRLYKDADGNYSRLDAEDKNQQRAQLNAFINENCY